MSKRNPKIAVVTRTKNRNILLKRALRSVQGQTYKDFIHVVVNDGGDPEEVNAAVKDYGSENVKVVHNKKSIGLTPALNQAIKAVDSKYVAILDDDDSWDSRYLELTVDYLEKTSERGVVAVIDKVNEVIEDGKVKELSRERWRPDISFVSLYGQCIDNYAPTVAFVYQRKIYDELGGYDESLGVSEDWDFALRFLLKYDVGFLATPEALAFYHHRPSVAGDLGNSVFDRVDQHKYHINMLANKFLRQDLKEGKFGVGYIINSLRYDLNTLVPREEEKQLAQTIRLEGHMNHVGTRIVYDINKSKGLAGGARRLKQYLKKRR